MSQKQPSAYLTKDAIENINKVGRARLAQIKAKRRGEIVDVRSFEDMLAELPTAIAARPLVVNGMEIKL